MINHNLDGLWNRNSAWSPAQLAVLTVATTEALQIAATKFKTKIDGLGLNDEQTAEAYVLLANSVTAEMQRVVESLKVRV